jgi:peptidoglycan/xylan/chitin deacetylase (PgdA/CDA1 family)
MIFLYHAIADDAAPFERSCVGQALPSRAFRNQVAWLAESFEIVSLSEYLREGADGRTNRGRAALTFDDGLASTFRRVFAFLAERSIPATFFVSTGHLDGGPLLWFSFFNALCFETTYPQIRWRGRVFPLGTLAQRAETRRALESIGREEGNPTRVARELEAVYPLPADLREEHAGMTRAQVRAAAESGVFEIGSHTVSHPFLSRLPRGEQAEEIAESRRVLAEMAGCDIRYFAYPSGDYDRDTLDLLRGQRFDAALATISRRLGSEFRYEIDRIGIYSTALWKVKLKAWGAADLARRLGMRVG